ncbi:galactosylgalactosylxylosylprotein 3-beta-glucuronosyltransferase 3-like [Oppia nitens]|uniref:galactosylgalactosylxylosylprotein 3-beta-glucuronosyltransferase 3-like n=1 Tax=Oppia nitens TaxID=1686743 RepID=UPI0023DAF0BC|nr:galactosylgalactosylxylosylprotein 3-beta-glucuronosyltransferase 3-like [Oppia nitens]
MRIWTKLLIIQILVIIVLLVLSVVLNFYCIENNELEKTLKIRADRLSLKTPLVPTIYVITPTYDRLVQKAELIRLSNTLLLVDNIHWIVVEDSPFKTQRVTKFLEDIEKYGHLKYTHLNVVTPTQFQMKKTDPNWLKPRGVLQRNAGIDWIRENVKSIDGRGVVYFADDDNTYDLKLFSEMRNTRRVSVWPVGLVGGLIVETPIVINGKVNHWNTMWKKERQFPIDMSGFAVNLQLLLDKPNAYFTLKASRGYQETLFIHQLITGVDQLEPKAVNCSEILVWHTRTALPDLKQEHKLNSPSHKGFVF